jgi:hypothetical protein
MRGGGVKMSEKYQIYDSGEQYNRLSVWRDYIYASYLKNGTWTITLISDGDEGRYIKSRRRITHPTDFVNALYDSENLDIDNDFVKNILNNLFPVSPNFAVACAIYNDIENDGAETDLEEFLEVLPSFTASHLSLPKDFESACELGGKIFKALSESARNGIYAKSVPVDGKSFPIAWNRRISKELRTLRTEKLIEEHCRKSEWQKSTGHSHAAMGNGHKYNAIKRFVAHYYAEHGKLPVGDFILGSDFMRSAGSMLGELAVKFK